MPVRVLVSFNRDKRQLFDAVALPFDLHFSSEEDLLRGLVERELRYFCPATDFSVPLLEQRLAEASPETNRIELRMEAFGAVPIVLLMSPEIYDALTEGGPVGWKTLLEPSAPLTLMHAHDNSADGLAVLAAINQAATQAFGSVPIEQEHAGRDGIIHAVEGLVRQYAPDDLAVLQHGLAEGRWRADVLALRQDTAYAAMQRHPGLRAVMVHPSDGSAWAHLVLGTLAEGSDEDSRCLLRDGRGAAEPPAESGLSDERRGPSRDGGPASHGAGLDRGRVAGRSSSIAADPAARAHSAQASTGVETVARCQSRPGHFVQHARPPADRSQTWPLGLS